MLMVGVPVRGGTKAGGDVVEKKKKKNNLL